MFGNLFSLQWSVDFLGFIFSKQARGLIVPYYNDGAYLFCSFCGNIFLFFGFKKVGCFDFAKASRANPKRSVVKNGKEYKKPCSGNTIFGRLLRTVFAAFYIYC